MLVLADKTPVVCSLYLAERLTDAIEQPQRSIMHILNALIGFSPPTSKPLISATTREKLSSIAAIRHYKYVNDDPRDEPVVLLLTYSGNWRNPLLDSNAPNTK
jgi:hypothetical protein